MKRLRRIAISTAALMALSMAGCVDLERVEEEGTETEVRQQAVTVVPEFMITGSEAIPESLFVTDLGLAVSEIRLEPMWSKDALAYSTRDPMVIEFDVSKGETFRTAEALELPEEGRYLVSIRLEPITLEGEDSANSMSFAMNGFVEQDELDDEQEKTVDDTSDGRPQPMPFDPDDKPTEVEMTDVQAAPTQWMPFEYHSKRAVFFTFSDVVFEPGEQFLTFTFDVRTWAADVAEPISNAVRSNETDTDSVDVSRQLDASGSGVEALIETGVVQSGRR